MNDINMGWWWLMEGGYIYFLLSEYIFFWIVLIKKYSDRQREWVKNGIGFVCPKGDHWIRHKLQ